MGFMPEPCRSWKVFCASCLRPIGLLRLTSEWKCSFRVFALSGSAVYVFHLAFSAAIPPESCVECFRTEYNVLVLTLGRTSMSFSSLLKHRMSFRYLLYVLSVNLRTYSICFGLRIFLDIRLPDLDKRL